MDEKKLKHLKQLVSEFNILFVEDNQQTLDQLVIMFKELFNSVECAINGKEAIEKYNSYKKHHDKYFDIVITDIRMPIMDGFELSKEIKQINPKQPILVISAHNESKTLEKLIEIGITTYIHKPVEFEDIINAIYKVAELKQESDKVNEAIIMNNELNALIKGYDSLVIASRTDKDGIITYVSSAFTKISGYTKEELIGQKQTILRSPNMPDSIFEEISNTVNSGKVWNGKIENIRKDGSSYWVELTTGPFRDEDGEIIGYNHIRQDITAQIEAQELHKKVNLLLNNSNDGYLLFDNQKKVTSGYSKKCLEIFNKDKIEDENITILLFSDNQRKTDLFEKGINLIFQNSDEDMIENFLSLLPKSTQINEKYISISYKYINSNSIMVILSDISENINLKSELEKQQIEQKMVVNIIANINDFLELDENYKKLIQQLYKNTENSIHLPEYVNDTLRELHTYKGLFYQMNMVHSPHAIHELETKIAQMQAEGKKIASLETKNDIKFLYRKDINIIDSFLGKEYLKEQRKIILKSKALVNLKYKIRNIIKYPENINFKLQNLISQIDQMSYDSLTEILEKHIPLVIKLGKDLNKPMKPLKIIADEDVKVPATLKSFFRNMVHIYKNCIDHGIENSDLRLQRGKDIKGEIICTFRHEQSFLFIEISDDGNGIDIELLKDKLLNQKVLTKKELDEASETKILNYIFSEQITTKNEQTDISGRGIGMSSIKKSLEELNGSIKILNKPQKGLTYNIKIPLIKVLDVYESGFHSNEIIKIMDLVTNQIKEFLTDELNIDIIDSKYVNTINIEEKVHVLIDIESGTKLSFSLSFNKTLLKKFASIFFIEIDENQNDLDKILSEVAKEIINTIIGLSIQDFPNIYKEGILSTPYSLNEKEIYDKLHDEENKVITNMITTGSGKLISNLILRG